MPFDKISLRLRHRRALGFLTAIVCSVAFAFVQSAPAQTTLDSEELAFVQLINNYRQQNGLGPLQVSLALTTAAKWMSADMGTNRYFSHIDSLGRDPYVRMAAFGYGYVVIKGENIAAGNSTAQATFDQWRNSPDHNANMLQPGFLTMGIGRACVSGSPYGCYWTNDFGGYVDQTISLAPPTPGDIPVQGDYDGDGRTDYAVWRPSNGVWYIIRSSTGQAVTQQWGLTGDVPVPGDYDNDGKTDYAVWRPSNGTWWVLPSSTGQYRTQQWGLTGDVPVPGDYDGDHKTDYAVWRPSTGVWWILYSSTGQYRAQGWGYSTDVPVAGDYDGDGKTDIAVWRPSTGVWWILYSSNGQYRAQGWGITGDVPVPGDYDGDHKTDIAVWRPSTGVWWMLYSSNGQYRTQQWGMNGDLPVPGDYDNDGRTDFGVWRPSTGFWWVLLTSTGQYRTQQWGMPR